MYILALQFHFATKPCWIVLHNTVFLKFSLFKCFLKLNQCSRLYVISLFDKGCTFNCFPLNYIFKLSVLIVFHFLNQMLYMYCSWLSFHAKCCIVLDDSYILVESKMDHFIMSDLFCSYILVFILLTLKITLTFTFAIRQICQAILAWNIPKLLLI